MNGEVDQKKLTSQDPQYWFKHQEERVMTDPRFINATPEEKKIYLENFYDEYGSKLMEKEGYTDPTDLEWAKNYYVSNKMKEDVAPEKPDLPGVEMAEPKKPSLASEIGRNFLMKRGQKPKEEEPQRIPPTDDLDGILPEGKPEGLLANVPEIGPEGENLKKDPFLQDVQERLRAGVARLPSLSKKATKFMERLTDLPMDIISKELEILGVHDPKKREKLVKGIDALLIPKPKFKKVLEDSNKLKDIIDEETDYYDNWDQVAENLSERSKRYDETITEMWKQGNYKGVAGSAMLYGAESLPQSMLAAFGGFAGLASLGFMAGGEKYEELKEMGVDEGPALLNATLTGTIESVTELGTAALGSLIKGAYKKIGKEAAEEVVKTGLRNWMTAFYKKVGIYTAPVQEGIEEYVNQVGVNLTDKYTGVDPDRKIDEGVFDAFMAGVGGGTYFTAMGIAAEVPKAVMPKKKEKPKPFEFIPTKVAPEAETAVREYREAVEKARPKPVKMAPEVEEAIMEKRRIEAEMYDYDLEQTQMEMGLPGTPDIDVPVGVEETLDKLDTGEPVVNERLKESSDFMYDEYKRLEAMKKNPGRVYTVEQIENMQEFLGEEITRLNDRINEQAEKGEFVTRPVELTDEITVSEIAEEPPAEAPEEAPPEEVEKPPTAQTVSEAFAPFEGEGVQEVVRETAAPLKRLIPEKIGDYHLEKVMTIGGNWRISYIAGDKKRGYTGQAFPIDQEQILGKTDEEILAAIKERAEKNGLKFPEEAPPPEPVTDVEERLGPPQEIGSTTAKEFADVVEEKVGAYDERVAELEQQKQDIDQRIQTEFGEEVTLESKELEGQIADIEAQQEVIRQEQFGTLEDYSKRIEQPLIDIVEEMKPDYTIDQTNEVLAAAWEKMQNPSELEADMPITEIVRRTIHEIEAAPPAAPVPVEEVAPVPVEEPAVPEVPVEGVIPPEERMVHQVMLPGKLDEKSESHNQLIELVEQYNAMPKSWTKKRQGLYSRIFPVAQQLGYMIDQKKGKLIPLDPAGKKLKMVGAKVTKEDIQARPALQEYEDKTFVQLAAELTESPHFLMAIASPMTPSEIMSGAKNIKEGNKTVAGNNLLDYLYTSFRNGIFAFKETKNNPDFEITVEKLQATLLDEKLDSFLDEFGFPDPSNVDQAIEMGLMSEEQKQELLKEYEEAEAAEAELERGEQPEVPGGIPVGEVGLPRPGPEAAEEVVAPEEEPPAPEIDVRGDLDQMLGLLDQLKDPNEPKKLSQGTGNADASAKMLQVSMGLVDKVISGGKYRFDEVLETVIPNLPRPQLEALLPHLKSGYMGYAANAPAEVQQKMDLGRTLSFDNTDLDVLIGQMNKPPEAEDKFEDIVDKHFFIPGANKTFYVYRIEQWNDPRDAKVNMIKGSLFQGMPDEFEKLNVAIIGEAMADQPPNGVVVDDVREAIKRGKIKEIPPYDNPEYSAKLEEIIDIYLSMGDAVHAERTRRRIPVKPRDISGKEVPWEEKAADLLRAAEIEKKRYDIEAGKIMYSPIDPLTVNLQELFDDVESTVKQGAPITPFIKERVPPALLDRLLTVARESHKLVAQLGYTQKQVADDYYLRKNFFPGAPSQALYPIGAKARGVAEGRREASEKKVKDAVKALEESLNKAEEQHQKVREKAFEWDIKNTIWTGQFLPDIKALRALGEKWGVTDQGRINDIADLALVKMARTINQDLTLSVTDRLTQIKELEKTFPLYESKWIKNHEPSTPIALSQILNEYLNANGVSNVVDPIAGNGSRLIGARMDGVRANEQNPQKRINLASIGFRTHDVNPGESVIKGMDIQRTPALIISSLKGVVPEEKFRGFNLSSQQVPVVHNLNDMSDDGKAVIILPGHLKFKGLDIATDVPFYKWLYKHYNVQDLIQVAPSIYAGQGYREPTHIILINGRKADPFEELPRETEAFDPVDEIGVLQDRILSLTSKPNEKSILQPKVDAGRGSDNIVDGATSPEVPDKTNVRPGTTFPGEAEAITPAGRTPEERGPVGEPTGPDPGEGRRGTDTTDPGPPSIPTPEVGVGPTPTGGRPAFGTLRPKRDPIDLPTNNIGKPTERSKRDAGLIERSGDEVTPYVPLSRVGSGNYVIPASIAPEVERALLQLRNQIGDVDEYVRSKLNYNSVQEMSSAFFAEQVDGVAQTIFNIEGDNAMIISHQTGTGKGRIAAAAIRYAVENGKLPIFVTKSAKLFTDMYRDLRDISTPREYQPFIMNKTLSSGKTTTIINDETEEVMFTANPGQIDKAIGKEGQPGTMKLPDGTDVVMTTYSQFSSEENAGPKREFMEELARNNDVVFIMDESHEASGNSRRGEFFRRWLPITQGGVFLSATYAKRPDNLPLYAMKTVLQDTNMEYDQMVEAMQNGGPALQEIITLQLAESGQFSKIGFRFDAEMNNLIVGDDDASQRTYDPELGDEMVEKYDQVTSVLRDLIDFQNLYVHPAVAEANLRLQAEYRQAGVDPGQAKTFKQYYAGLVWNVVDQLMLSLKVRSTVPLVVEDLRNGQKPVIALTSTMENMFDNMTKNGELEKGETIDLDFVSVLKRGLRSVFRYTERDAEGDTETKSIDLFELSAAGQQAYAELDSRIKATKTDIPLSPIDVLRKGIEDAGFEFVEITGRKTMFEMNADMTRGKFVNKPRVDQHEALNKFNNSPGVAAIINRSGATGISMHSSPKFADTNQRSMYILQNDMDINVVVQMMGRVYRANQLNKPIYNILTSKLPAEMRQFMLNAKKLKSLDANTSGNQKQSKNIVDVSDLPDYINKYGDGVVVRYLEENTRMNEMLGDPVGIKRGRKNVAGAAHKVSGKVQILPSELQDQYNEEIVAMYNTEIQYLNSIGRNNLMVTTEDLDAEILVSELSVQGRGGKSAFGQNTMLNFADVDVVQSPFNQKQLQERIDDIPDNHVEDTRADMEEGIEANLTESLNAIEKKYEEFRALWKKNFTEAPDLTADQKQQKYQDKVKDLDKSEQNAIQRARATTEERKKTFTEYLDYFTPGQGLEVPESIGGELQLEGVTRGVFLQFKIPKNKSNPWVPSNFILEFATNDSRKLLSIPASKEAHLEVIMRNSSHLNPTQSRDILERWDETKPPTPRDGRWIATGNILQGMGKYNEGRLIQFTKKDGTVEKGILMSDTWRKPESTIATVSINTAADIVKTMNPNELVEDATGDVLIKKLDFGDPQMYEIHVPNEPRHGKKYYTNQNLLNLLQYNKLEDNGPVRKGRFQEGRLQDVLDLLHEDYNTALEASNVQVGRARNTMAHHNTMKENGSPVSSKAKSRKGMPNPYNSTIGSEEKRVGGRIPAAPITGKKPKMVEQMQADLGMAVGYKTRYVRRLGAGVAGEFQPGSGRVAIKWQKDLDTTAHEIGHAIDDAFGLLGPEAHSHWGSLRRELMEDRTEIRDGNEVEIPNLSQFGSKPDPSNPNPEQYKMMEGMAEFIRAWMVNPDEAADKYPFTYNWFKQRVSQDPAVWEGLLQFSQDIREFWGAEIGDQLLSTIMLKPPKVTSMPKVVVNSILRRELRTGETEHGQFVLTPWDNWAQKYTNMFRPLERVWRWAMNEQGLDLNDWKKIKPTQRFDLMARLFLGLNPKLNSAHRDGLINFNDERVFDADTKQNLSWDLLMSQIPNHSWKDMEANKQEAYKLGLAERVMEVPWKLEDKQIRMDLENSINRLPPQEVLDRHLNLQERYGHMIDAIQDKINNGDLDPDDVYLPVERYDKFYKKTIIGVADETLNDYEKAKEYVEDFERREAADPESVKWIREFNRIYRDIGEQIIKYAYDSGMITEDVYNTILETNLHYFALQRLHAATPEELAEGRAGEGLSVSDVSSPDKNGMVSVIFHGVKGSEKLIKDPIDALMDSYQKVVENGDKNHVIKLFAQAFNQMAFGPERSSYDPKKAKMGEVAWVSRQPEVNSIPYRNKGKQEYINFADREMYGLFSEMMFGYNENKIPAFLTWLPQWLRKSVVTAPIFAVRNVTRDFRHFLTFGEGVRYLPEVILDASRDAALQVFAKGTRRKEIRAAFDAHGGGQFGYMVTDKVGYYELQRETMFRMSKDPKKIFYGRKQLASLSKKKVSAGLSGFEKATRMIQFRASIKKGQRELGLSPTEAMTRAAYQSRDLMDFMVGGKKTQELNRMIIFLNPAIRGWEKMYRSLKDPKTRGRVLLRIAIWQAMGGMLNSLIVSAFGSDEDKEEYLNAPAYQRDMYDRIPLGGGTWLFIPRPFELAAITSLAQRGMDKLLFNDPNAFNKDYWKSLGHILLPTDLPGLFSGYTGAINWAFNKDFFRQKNIIAPTDVDLPISGRNTDYASKFSKMMMKGSDLMTKEKDNYLLDPRLLDAAISGQFSYYGNFWLKSWETILPGESQDKYKFDLKSTGFVRKSFHYGEPDVQWVLRAADVNDKLATSSGYSALQSQIRLYFDPEIQNDKQKRREVGAQLREDAKTLRSEYEEDMMKAYTRAKQKKEKGRGAPTL